MTQILTRSVVCLILCMILNSFQANNASAQTAVSLQVFYDDLQPYGQWISDEQYGYAWVPNVQDDFQPYATNGFWVMTEFGNTWVSTYSWGWAPFHYGRWLYDTYYGWIWIPGYEWGPAWVCWRHGGGYYGWAPLGPWFVLSVTLGAYSCPQDWWVFIPQHQIYHRNPHYRRNSTTIINNTTIITNTHVHDHVTYVMGPRKEEIHSTTGNSVHVYNIEDTKSPGDTKVQENSLQIFRPTIHSSETGHTPVQPANVIKGPRSISVPRSVKSNGGDRPEFLNETWGTRRPQSISKDRSPTPVRRKPAGSHQQDLPARSTRPTTSPSQHEQRPVKQPGTRPTQQRPVQKNGSKAVQQQQSRPIRK